MILRFRLVRYNWISSRRLLVSFHLRLLLLLELAFIPNPYHILHLTRCTTNKMFIPPSSRIRPTSQSSESPHVQLPEEGSYLGLLKELVDNMCHEHVFVVYLECMTVGQPRYCGGSGAKVLSVSSFEHGVKFLWELCLERTTGTII